MVGIIILDYNNATDTINCIESVIKYTPESSYKIVIVENGSNKNTTNNVCDYVTNTFRGNCIISNDNVTCSTYFPLISVIISDSNEGYARGNNKALRLLEKDNDVDYIMILNNDIIFIEDIVTPLLKKSQEIPSCGIISPLLVKKDCRTIDHCCARNDYPIYYYLLEQLVLYKNWRGILSKCRSKYVLLGAKPELINSDYFDIEIPSGSCMLIKKEIFKRIGYFDENTFLYFEENILFQKTKRLKLRNILIPKLKCIHLGASTSKRNVSSFIMQSQINSELYYLRTYRKAHLLAFCINILSKITICKLKIREHFQK